MTQPWGPNILAAPMEMAGLGIGTGSPELDGLQYSPRSPELDGRAVTPEGARWGAAPAVSPLIGTPVQSPPAEGRGGGEAQGHATATTGSSLPEALVAGQTQQREARFMDPASTAPEVASPGAGGKGTGAGGNGFLSPVPPSTGRGSGMSTGMVSSLSGRGRGSWLSPEMAMAGGWRNEEEGGGG